MAGVWVDFKLIKASVSMEMALGRYGIRLRRVSRDYLRGECPLPTHQSPVSNQSLIVNVHKNVWSCQSASCVAARGGSIGGNVFDFVAAMENCSIRDAAVRLQQSFCGAEALRPKLQTPEMSQPLNRDRSAPKPLSFKLRGVDTQHPYLMERSITPQVARQFEIGYFAGTGFMSGRIVIPIHSIDGAVVAYAGRSLGAVEPRYRFPPGFRKSLFLFNLHRAVQLKSCQVVVVVEGFFDCLKTHQAGHHCVVALMGSTLSSPQADLLKHNFEEVILMLDGDSTGRAATSAIAARLRRTLPVRVAYVPSDRQPDQLPAEEIRRLIHEAT
jgi:DNA primase